MVPDGVTPEAVGMNSAQLERVGEHLRRRYIEPGKIPGSITLVARRGQPCYLDVAGRRDVERDTPMTADTIVRIYSMTKPVTSVALMTLYERGLFSLDDRSPSGTSFVEQWFLQRKTETPPLRAVESCAVLFISALAYFRVAWCRSRSRRTRIRRTPCARWRLWPWPTAVR